MLFKIKKENKSEYNIEFKSVLDGYGLETFKRAIYYKDVWRKDENEYRIINWYTTNDQCNGIDNCEKGKLCNYYYSNLSNGTKIANLKYNDCIGNFHKFFNFEENKDIVKEVIIRPKNPVDYDYIIELLRANRYNVDKISVSKSLGMVK